MINLIPQEKKKQMVRNFYGKMAVLFFVMGSLAILVGLALMLPAYFLYSAKNSIVQAKIESQKNERLSDTDLQSLSVIKDLNNKLTVVEQAENNKFIFSKKIMNNILLRKVPDIKITAISYESDPLKGKKINIAGNAPSREVLLSFRLALENDEAFKKVDLPVSNFVKGSNIKFSLSLTPSQDEK